MTEPTLPLNFVNTCPILPTSVRLGIYLYQVEQVPDLKDDKGDTLEGCIEYDTCTIKVRANLTPMGKYQVLWHELLHGISDVYHVKFRSEAELDLTASALVELLRDNPMLRVG